jgi:hypothetical protein
MDERLRKCTTPSSTAFPLAGPTTIHETTTPSRAAKSHSAPGCDEHPIGHAAYPTTVGIVSQSKQSRRSYYPPHQ